jgi:uroporphyrinogen decarboxylase
MTPRERFIATLTYGKPDRIPFVPGYGRRSTRERWYREGLPEGVDPVTQVVKVLNLPIDPQVQAVDPGIVFTMMPEFEEKVIERRPAPPDAPPGARGSIVVQDWKGNICEIGDEFSPSDLRGAPDFVTRSWIKCPVESRADWDDMKRRYHIDQPGRFPDDFKQRCRQLRERTYVSGMIWSGPFWQLREWLGFENLCMLLLDDPDFARDMVAFWQEYVAQMLTRTFEQYVPDYIMVNEDMAYKEKPMIGPDMSREFLLPCWRRWTELARQAGVPVVAVDSDGYIESLVPVWVDAGFNGTSPLEVAAANDLPALSRRYGKTFSWQGGVDKRKMAEGGQAIRKEMARLQPVVEAGGFIPSCDHGVPSDVSWPDFVEYSRLLAQATGWL